MGTKIVKHAVRGKDRYVLWSSICDAPTLFGCTLRQLKNYWREEYGRSGLEDLERGLESGHKRIFTVAEVSSINRAGKDSTHLTDEQIVDYYFVRCGEGEQPVGTDPFVEDEELACSLCGGGLVLLGKLGSLDHYRCRNCGAEMSKPRHGLHCLRPDACNPDKGPDGCVCECHGCRYQRP